MTIEGMIIMTNTLTTAQVAEKLETTPRTLRKFLRADAKANGTADALPGKGSRYSIEAKKVQSLKSRFKKWEAAEAEARAERIAKKAQDADEAPATDEAGPIEVEDANELEEPTDADIEALEGDDEVLDLDD